MPSKVKNNLARLAAVERHIAQFKKLFDMNEQSVKVARSMTSEPKLTINIPLKSESDKIQQLRLQLSTRESELDQKALELADAKQKMLDQAKRHQKCVDELMGEIARKPQPIMAELGVKTYTGQIVENWRDSKKWISNWCFGLIAFCAVTPIPPEMLTVLPDNIRYYVIAFTAFCGFAGRYINQSRSVPLPPTVAGDTDV